MSTNTSRENGARHDFTKYKPLLPVPDLLAIQLDSWEQFLQEDILPEKRENKGLESVFRNMFPIEDARNDYVLEYKTLISKYNIDDLSCRINLKLLTFTL